MSDPRRRPARKSSQGATEIEPVIGPYKILRVIGEGGMSVVYEAEHADGPHVALKVLKTRKRAGDSAERFRREARIAAQLTSMHVTKVLSAGVTPKGRPYIAMELLKGVDLAQELSARAPLPVVEAVDYVLQAGLALADAHRFGIVHRDVKPGNIFLCDDCDESGRRLVKVLDFGISKVDDGAKLTQSFDSFGTPQYMSPEQVRATRDVDARSDIWSLGVVLYEALSGAPPFDGPATRVISSIAMDSVPPLPPRVDIPEGLETIITKALQKDPEKRYQSALELVEDLTPFGPSAMLSVEPGPATAMIALVPPLGTILIQAGVIDAQQLRHAIERQEIDRRPLGDVLISMSACPRSVVERALECQREMSESTSIATVMAEFRRGFAEDPPAASWSGVQRHDGPPTEPDLSPGAFGRDPLAAPTLPSRSPELSADEEPPPDEQTQDELTSPNDPSSAGAPSGPVGAGRRPRAPQGARQWTPILAALLAGAAVAAGAVWMLKPSSVGAPLSPEAGAAVVSHVQDKTPPFDDPVTDAGADANRRAPASSASTASPSASSPRNLH